jgi:hypothetical protein
MSIEFSWPFDTAGNHARSTMFRRDALTDRHNWSIGSTPPLAWNSSQMQPFVRACRSEWSGGVGRRGIVAATDRDLEALVPYALFENDEQMTRPFRTEREVWEAAEQADLITFGTHGEKILDNNLEIKSCEATPEELTAVPPDVVLPEAHAPDSASGNGSADLPLPSPQKTKTEASS